MGYYRTGAISYARGRPVYAMAPDRKRPGTRVRKGTGAPLRRGPRVQQRRRPNTYTKQQRRRKRINRAVKQGDNSSFSYTMMKASWNPKLRSLYRVVQGRQTRFEQAASSASSGTGLQGATALVYNSTAQLSAIALACNDGVATNNSVRCFLGNLKMRCSFKNQSNAVGKLLIYDLLCKKSTPSTALDSPTEAWNKGLGDFGGSATLNSIGATPNASPEFRNYWSIKKCTAIMLEPGQQHDHVLNRSINKVYDSTYWANNVGASLAWLSGAVMFVWHGSLIHESATPTTVTYSDMRLDYAYTLEYNFGYMKQNLPSHTVVSQFPTTITDPDFMGEAGDIDANITNA